MNKNSEVSALVHCTRITVEVGLDGRFWTMSIYGTPTFVTSHNQEY